MNPKIIVIIVLACLAVGCGVWYFQRNAYLHECNKTKNVAELRLKMRTLWDDHVIYSRDMFSSILDNLGNKEEVVERLMQNQDAIGDAFIPYYGKEAGNTIATLLREHIRLAVEIVQDAKDENTKKSAQDKAEWIANAHETAQFLSSINPHWSQEDLQARLLGHLESAEGELNARLKKEWATNLGFYDKGRKDMLKLADVITDGIVEQFPDKCE